MENNFKKFYTQNHTKRTTLRKRNYLPIFIILSDIKESKSHLRCFTKNSYTVEGLTVYYLKMIRNNFQEKQFGIIHVIHQTDDYKCSNQKPRVQWLCQCDTCKQQMPLTVRQIKKQKRLSCGCQNQPRKPREYVMTKSSIKPNMTFGNLTVIERTPDHYTPSGIKKPQWLCECVCKKESLYNNKD